MQRCLMASIPPRRVLIGNLVIVPAMTFVAGMNFMVGFEGWLRSDPALYWTQGLLAVVFVCLSIVVCRRILAMFSEDKSR